MDKRTVWGLKAGDDPIICHCLDKPRCQDASHCTEYALVDPQELASLESQDTTANEVCAAQGVPHGEDYYTQFCREHTDAEARAFLIDQNRKADKAVEFLTAACAAKDEVLREFLKEYCNCRHDCSATWVNPTCDHGPLRKMAEIALSQTPAAAARLAEEAAGFRRIKELVTDIRERLTRQNCEPIAILDELEQVIAQAKGGDTG